MPCFGADMSGLAASPRASESFERISHPAHQQMRHLHPMPPNVSGPLPSSAMITSCTPLTPAETNGAGASGGYFGYVVDPADPANAQHSLRNWSPASSIRSAAARSPLPIHVDNPSTPFQQQAEILAHKLQHPNSIRKRFNGTIDIEQAPKPMGRNPGVNEAPNTSVGDYFTSFKSEIPHLMHNSTAENWPAMSAPASIQTFSPPPARLKLPERRPSSVAPSTKNTDPGVLEPKKFSDLLRRKDKSDLLVLDVRTYKAFSESRISAAVNLCIPTTLLKRPSFNIAKLSETFADDNDKQKFGNWKSMNYIVVYDADSQTPSDSSGLAALHTMSKFQREGWSGHVYMLRGGFAAFAEAYPDLVDSSPLANKSTTSKKLTLGGAGHQAEKVIGGIFNCPLPMNQSAMNPFFSNIRQNMDLIDGVGEIPIQLPQSLGSDRITQLPAWLRQVAVEPQGAKIVADRFLAIERAEQKRMQEALNVSVKYDSPTSTKPKPHTIAGVEKGTKNRYNNIWPYDHARVKLQDYPAEECDYVNASHISEQYGQKRYIASQAPLPTTFRDFWSMVWEQDVRVIVMLTAEEEGGRLKSHNYWKTGNYGPLHLNCLQERKVSLDPSFLKGSPKRRSVSSSIHPSSADSNAPFVVVRKFTLEHTTQPFSPMREITQLQYSEWPDFGTPTHPAHVLGLVEHTDAVVRSTNSSSDMTSSRRPVLVHCSAGCGRTGTFCTIDSVIAMMKRQRLRRRKIAMMQNAQNLHHDRDDSSDGDGHGSGMRQLDLEDADDSWMQRDDEDLVYKAVCEFRNQRLSMVQCLQQYVLCYEAVLEWLAKQSPLDSGNKRKL